jgi:hypothetical protein
MMVWVGWVETQQPKNPGLLGVRVTGQATLRLVVHRVSAQRLAADVLRFRAWMWCSAQQHCRHHQPSPCVVLWLLYFVIGVPCQFSSLMSQALNNPHLLLWLPAPIG